MAALPSLMTVERFRELPDDGRAYELHAGELVEVTWPKLKHYKIQMRLVRLLEPFLRSWGEVGVEVAYRPVPQSNSAWRTSQR